MDEGLRGGKTRLSLVCNAEFHIRESFFTVRQTFKHKSFSLETKAEFESVNQYQD